MKINLKKKLFVNQFILNHYKLFKIQQMKKINFNFESFQLKNIMKMEIFKLH